MKPSESNKQTTDKSSNGSNEKALAGKGQNYLLVLFVYIKKKS